MQSTPLEPRLLVIDDDHSVVALVTQALHEVGWRVSACSDPARVCEQVASEQPNAILLDIYLQFPASGWRVLQALREEDSTRDVPVIVFSGYIRDLEEKEAWLLEQQIGVLSKPFELEDLYDAVEEYQPTNGSKSPVWASRLDVASNS